MLDDDYFIGSPLNKSDLFYEENGRIYPFIISNEFKILNHTPMLKNYLNKYTKKKEDDKIYPHTSQGFRLLMLNNKLLLYKYFGEDDIRNGKPLIDALDTHNAYPMDLNTIKEIHDFIEQEYEYANFALNSKYRHMKGISIFNFYQPYVLNKYNRLVNSIPSSFYSVNNADKVKKGDILFVINESNIKYSKSNYENMIKKLEELFPYKTLYEKESDTVELNKINTEQNKLYSEQNRLIAEQNRLNSTVADIQENTKNLQIKLESYENNREKETKRMKKSIVQIIIISIIINNLFLFLLRIISKNYIGKLKKTNGFQKLEIKE